MQEYHRGQRWEYLQIVRTFDEQYRSTFLSLLLVLDWTHVVYQTHMCNRRRMPWRFILVELGQYICSRCFWFLALTHREFYCMIRCSISVILQLIDEYHWSIFDSWIFKVSTWCRFGIFRRQLIIRLWGILRVMHSFMDLCNYLIFRKIVWFYLRRIFDKRIILFWAYPLWYLQYLSQE